MNGRICLFALLISSSATAVEFQSDFEGTVEVIAPSVCSKCKFSGDIVGASNGYSWDTDFPGANYPNRLLLILGEDGSNCTSDPDCCCSQMDFDEWMTIGIVDTTGPAGQLTRALYYRTNRKWYNGPPDYTTARFSTVWGETPLQNDYTQQYWIKWPAEVKDALSAGDHWMSIFEQNTGVKPYMVQYVKRLAAINGGKLHWQWRRGGGETTNNTTVEVPIDRWFKISIHFKAGKSNGRYKLDIIDQGQLLHVFDYTGDTGPGSAGASNFIKQYSDVAPLSVYYDNYVLFAGEVPLTTDEPHDAGLPDLNADAGTTDLAIDSVSPETRSDAVADRTPAKDGASADPPAQGCSCNATGGAPPSLVLMLLFGIRRRSRND